MKLDARDVKFLREQVRDHVEHYIARNLLYDLIDDAGGCAVQVAAPRVPDGITTCPFCKYVGPPYEDDGDDMFAARRGCLNCNRWWDPVVFHGVNPAPH